MKYELLYLDSTIKLCEVLLGSFKYVGYAYESTNVTNVNLSSSDRTATCNIAMFKMQHFICNNAIFQILTNLM